MLVDSMQHTHTTSHSHTSHTTPEGRSIREGPRAWTLHSRGTALALRREGLARHHLRQSPNGEMSHQNMGLNMEQLWTPKKGDKRDSGDGKEGMSSSEAEGWVDRRASGALTTYTTRVQESQHKERHHKKGPTQSTHRT